MTGMTYEQWADALQDGDLEEARRCWDDGMQSERLLGSLRSSVGVLVGDLSKGPNTLAGGQPLHTALQVALDRRFS